jgi:hypothetical protein
MAEQAAVIAAARRLSSTPANAPPLPIPNTSSKRVIRRTSSLGDIDPATGEALVSSSPPKHKHNISTLSVGPAAAAAAAVLRSSDGLHEPEDTGAGMKLKMLHRVSGNVEGTFSSAFGYRSKRSMAPLRTCRVRISRLSKDFW